MKTSARRVGVVTAAVWLVVSPFASVATLAQASPDEPAAVLVYPYIAVDPASGTDTLIQLSNTSSQPVELRCFYANLTPQCTKGQPGGSCFPGAVTCTGLCISHEARTPLRIRATAGQPLAWHASTGLPAVPLPMADPVSGRTQSNQFSDIPGVGSGPFVGTLGCVAVTDDPYQPSSDNILVGQATIERSQGTPGSPTGYSDAAQYRAIGIKALSGGANRDRFLTLGGPDAEYEGCQGSSLLDHFFDGATLTSSGRTAAVTTTLILATCSTTVGTGMQVLVYNEFAQRFSSSRGIDRQLVIPLSMIDSADPRHSIFSHAVSGTLTGHTRIRGGGLHLVAIESRRDPSTPDRVQSDAINAYGVGVQQDRTVLAYRPPRCSGDCNFDARVTIDELILGVNMALGSLPRVACPPADANNDSEVTIDELVSAVKAALGSCPAPVAPTPVVTPEPTPFAVMPPQGAGPDIIHFGVATADDRPLQADSTDAMGRPVFARPFGQGMTLIIEARPGQSRRAVGETTYSDTGDLPDLQVLVSRPLGDGNPAVCEHDGHSGGIPAVPNLDFSPATATLAAINDLGCRVYDRHAQGPAFPCTRTSSGDFAMVTPVSTSQFCIPIAKAWAFPAGDTVVAARVRDVAGNLGPMREMVVRVNE